MEELFELFKNPTAEYRGKPFWAWNCKVEQAVAEEQLEIFKTMGFGGATIHCRTGLDTEYLGEEFMDCVKACVEKAKRLDIKIALYDEDRWPSGSAGGLVTKEDKYRSRSLIFTPKSLEERIWDKPVEVEGSFAWTSLGQNAKFLAKYDVILQDGYLHSYRRLNQKEEGQNVWYAYLQISPNSPWQNNQSYVNTMDKEAIEKFLEITHRKYYESIGNEFGDTVPSIFTDEPQFIHKRCLGRASDRSDLVIPYTDDFESSYREEYGESFLDHLPEVFWELSGEQVSVTRYRYHNHSAERFARAYADTVGAWCKDHNINLTGHLVEEPTLESQTRAIGEAMRHYRGFQIPGIDILCDWREYTTAKQAQSASHQMGYNKVMCELYGVTNWDFDFRRHKLQGDWLAALGITERVHHLSWMSMAGEAKRDYPASIFYQSPWYRKYNNIEEHYARVNTLLQLGRPEVKIGVIHPIESYWLCFGPEDQTSEYREKLERQFADVTNWLLFGLADFDYISESLMENLASLEQETNGFEVGKTNYEIIIVPGCISLRSSTCNRLQNFLKKGGKVIFMGDIAAYVDAQLSDIPKELAEVSTTIPFDQNKLLHELVPYRLLDIKNAKGVRSNNYIYQLRQLDNGDKILFVANGIMPESMDFPNGKCYSLYVRGDYQVLYMDTLTGDYAEISSRNENDFTVIDQTLYEQDSLLLYLKTQKFQNVTLYQEKRKEIIKTEYLNEVAAFSLSEPNVLVLDQAEYSLDEEPFSVRDEVLRIDNILRTRLNYPLKMEVLAQPYTVKFCESITHTLRLRYQFISKISCSVKLALEDAEKVEIELNGNIIKSACNGYFTDSAIKTVQLPNVIEGRNELILKMPYNSKSNLEWCYLLGDYGVELYGNKAEIVKLPSEIGFSDLVLQKFPFFAGNMHYQLDITVTEGEYELQINKFRAPLLSVKLDDKWVGDIQFSPYTVSLGKLEGAHQLEIIAYGSRVNAFGPIHLLDEKEKWIGPNAWRSTGCKFSYEYQLKPIGILSAPQIHKIK